MDREEARGKTALHARQPREARSGGGARGLALEQLPLLSSGRAWAGAGQRGLGKDFVSGTGSVNGKAHSAISRPPTLRKKPRRMGHPPCVCAIERLSHSPARITSCLPTIHPELEPMGCE